MPRRGQLDAGLDIRTNVVDGHVFPVCTTLQYLCAKRFTVFYYIVRMGNALTRNILSLSADRLHAACDRSVSADETTPPSPPLVTVESSSPCLPIVILPRQDPRAQVPCRRPSDRPPLSPNNNARIASPVEHHTAEHAILLLSFSLCTSLPRSLRNPALFLLSFLPSHGQGPFHFPFPT